MTKISLRLMFLLITLCLQSATAAPVHFEVDLPSWLVAEMDQLPKTVASLEERMALVHRLARRNFQEDTGGPFAAAVFEQDSGKLIAVGVNRVCASGCSSAHAEVTCLSLAQRHLGTWDLGAQGLPSHQLVVNWRPCAMCFGASLWSGIRSLVIAGDGPELEALTGFDEGPVVSSWREELSRRGIELVENVDRQGAIDTFRDFGQASRTVYNARQGSPLKEI